MFIKILAHHALSTLNTYFFKDINMQYKYNIIQFIFSSICIKVIYTYYVKYKKYKCIICFVCRKIDNGIQIIFKDSCFTNAHYNLFKRKFENSLIINDNNQSPL